MYSLPQVTLKNEGDDAFKPEIYGKSITFQRTIMASGVSPVILKNHSQVTVLKNKEAREEGRRILECFRINVDNPIVILQQEEAKQLLRVESPGSLYNFFQRSTLLRQCIDQYGQAGMELERTKEIVKSKEEFLTEMKNRLNEKKKEYNVHIKIGRWENEETKLKQEFFLAHTKEIVEQITVTENELEKKTEEENKTKEKIEQLKNLISEDEMVFKKLDLEMKNEKQKYAEQEKELTEVKVFQ